jgi:hypothetical protein
MIMTEYPEVDKLYRVHPWNVVHVPPSFIPSAPGKIDASDARKFKTELEQLRLELARAQRRGEYQRAGELAYAQIPALEKKLKEPEAILNPPSCHLGTIRGLPLGVVTDTRVGGPEAGSAGTAGSGGEGYRPRAARRTGR